MARFVRSDKDIIYRVLRVLGRKKECDLEELIQECAEYSWSQVFLVVDHLTRTGELSLICKKAGDYSVRLPRAA